MNNRSSTFSVPSMNFYTCRKNELVGWATAMTRYSAHTYFTSMKWYWVTTIKAKLVLLVDTIVWYFQFTNQLFWSKRAIVAWEKEMKANKITKEIVIVFLDNWQAISGGGVKSVRFNLNKNDRKLQISDAAPAYCWLKLKQNRPTDCIINHCVRNTSVSGQWFFFTNFFSTN